MNKTLTYPQKQPENLIDNIAAIIKQAWQHVRQSVNSAMVYSYWEIGWLIVEDEQQGEKRAVYGKAQLQQISVQRTERFGKGFDIRNLRNMRSFYLAFPIRNALAFRIELDALPHLIAH